MKHYLFLSVLCLFTLIASGQEYRTGVGRACSWDRVTKIRLVPATLNIFEANRRAARFSRRANFSTARRGINPRGRRRRN